MKKISKILILALSLVIALSAFAIASSANSSPFLVEGLYRESWEDAIENAYIKGDRIVPVELLQDYEANGESVEITESVVVSLNGHTLKSDTTLFNVSGEDTTLTIVGPGTIYSSGTLVNVESGTFVFDATKGLNVISEGSDSVVVAGGEEKAYVTVKGELGFESAAGGSLFEILSGAEFNLTVGNSVVAKPTASATEPFAIVLACANSKVNVNAAVLSNSGGYVFKIGDDTDAELPAIINCESATLISDSTNFGSIVEAGSSYANISVRYSEIIAAGGAFTADNTLLNFEGDGKDKVYAKPTVTVNFVVSVYRVSEGNENANASLFNGNITGIVTASEIWNSETSAIGINTRLWDGECGILIKKGNKLSATQTLIASETELPLEDEDGVKIYFNPASTTNKNFSLDTINGEPCKLYKTTELVANNELLNFALVADKLLPFVDTDFSSSFNDPDGKNPTVDAITASYGSITFETAFNNDGSPNRFFQWEYDQNKKDQYSFKAGNSYIELDAGAGGATRGFNGLHMNELITWDFDIATSNGAYPYAGLKLFAREKTSSYAYTDNFGAISGNKFTVGTAGGFALSTTPYVWTHITLVFEIDTSGSYVEGEVTYYPNLGKSLMHFYANGEYQSSTKIFNANITTPDGLKKTSEFSLDSIRFGMSGGPSINKDASTSLLFDNNIVTYYPKGYTGNVSDADADAFLSKSDEYYNYVQSCKSNGLPVEKSIVDFVGNVEITLKDALINKYAINLKDVCDTTYKSGYSMPGVGSQDKEDGRPVSAIVDGVKYYNFEDVIGAITEGSVVYLYDDYDGVYNVNTTFTIYTKKADGGNYKFNVASDNYYLSEIRENGVLVGYETMLANSFITVYWQINTGYQTKVPLGIVPTYDWIVPSSYYDELGRYVELIGWSANKNATEPDVIGSITKDDLIKGYKVYYPVIAPSKVPVTFLDASGAPLKTLDIPVGTPESELKYYFDGKTMPNLEIDGNSWYEMKFSKWVIDGDAVGLYPINATPVFDEITIKPSAVKTSYSLVRLVDFSPTVYLLKPDAKALPAAEAAKISFQGFSFDGKLILEGETDWNNKYVYGNVKIGENEYYKLNLTTSKYPDKPGSLTLDEFPVYIHYTYDGVSKVQLINLNLGDYLEAAFLEADSGAEKSAMLEVMRLVKTYLELAGKIDSNAYAIASKYVNDPANAEYLSDYTKAIDKITPEKAAANATMGAQIREHFEDNVRWDFVNNRIYLTPLSDKYPKLSNAWTETNPAKDGKMVYIRDMASNARLGNSISGRTFNFTFSFNSNSGYKNGMITAYESETNVANKPIDTMIIYIYNEYTVDKRTGTAFTGYYNLTAHIAELQRRVDAGVKDIDDELKMAQIILATQFAVENCVFESSADGKPVTVPGADMLPVASMPSKND